MQGMLSSQSNLPTNIQNMSKIYKWQIKDMPAVENIPGPYSDLFKLVCSNIGLRTQEDIESFLTPDSTQLQSPWLLEGMNQIVDFLIEAIARRRKIHIHGDFDADGICATSILWSYLYRELGADVSPIVPDRFEEGYGLSEKTLERITAEDGDIVITVDCGVKNIDLIKKYNNLTFIITDHHIFPTSEDELKLINNMPNLIGVLHPLHPKSKFDFTEICGTTVAWKLISALAERTGNVKFDPNVFLPFVALATVTDIMPLIKENRYIVKQGLALANTNPPLGFESLFETAQLIKPSIDVYHFGFVLGPRLNAAGRIEDAMDAVRLFSTNNRDTAKRYAEKLNLLNHQRQEMTQELIDLVEPRALEQLENKCIFIIGDNWPEGILGLVAGKLQERFNRPILVASKQNNGDMIRGSARSPRYFHITDALNQFKHLLSKFGGHRQAAGFSLPSRNIENFRDGLLQLANTQITSEDLVPFLEITGEITLPQINYQNVLEIGKLAPFGYGNTDPKFVIRNLEVIDLRLVGRDQTHLKLRLSKDGKAIDAIGFGLANKFGDILPGSIVDVAGQIQINKRPNYNNVEILIKDIYLHE